MRDLKDRTKEFGINVIQLCYMFPQKQEFWIITKQLTIVEEEADECIYWMEVLERIIDLKNGELDKLKDEANQLVAITVTSKKTARSRK